MYLKSLFLLLHMTFLYQQALKGPKLFYIRFSIYGSKIVAFREPFGSLFAIKNFLPV